VTLETVQRRRVAIVDGTRRLDLVVPTHVTVAATLHAAQAYPQSGREVVVEAAGREISPESRIGDLRDGAILVLVDLAPGARGRGRRRPARPAGAERPSAVWWVMGGAGVVLAATALLAPAAFDPLARLIVGAVLAVGATAAAVVLAARAPRGRSSHVAAVLGILLLAFAAGTALIPAVPAAQGVLAVFTGVLFAAAVAGVMGVVSFSGTLRAEARTAMTVLLVLSAVWGGALLLHMDASAPAAVTLGLVPVALRVLLASVVDVAPGTFLDYERFQTTRWAVRQQLPDEVHSIDAADAGALVARSTARLTAGAMLFVLAGVASAPVAIPSFDGSDPLVLAGRIALAATVVLGLVLGARKTTVPALRWVSRLGAAAILAAVLVALIPLISGDVLVLVAGLCLAVGAASAFLVIPAGRGVHSLAWSRFADVIEWLAVALSLPAGLLAADVVDMLRGMMAA